MDNRPLRELTYKEVKEIKDDLKWITTNLNPEAYSLWQDRLKESFSHFNLIRYRLRGNLGRYFSSKEVTELKFALDEFLKSEGVYNKSKKFRYLFRISLNKKANEVFKKAKSLLEYIEQNLKT